ncbi:PREDICTED: putative methyltransferase At1g22800 [Lupinus angustifolius]|uniref:putative methyltransferase At1g22800 n=1 Tax=Lupinus angustifolius TaxID=3871 RepID=UPI00092E4724|nr:PREDICTED: putative methyltransferase At1g22800 [Lupinus angustifolius]
MMDASSEMVQACKNAADVSNNDNIESVYVVGDEEFLPIKESSLDLVISCLGLHWTNDLPGAMIQSRLALKSDGLFLAAILGGETLKELRIACTMAQMERDGGISPRVSPLAQACVIAKILYFELFIFPLPLKSTILMYVHFPSTSKKYCFWVHDNYVMKRRNMQFKERKISYQRKLEEEENFIDVLNSSTKKETLDMETQTCETFRLEIYSAAREEMVLQV